MKRLGQDVSELFVDFVLGPEKVLQVLDPLKIRHHDPTGVRQDIGNDKNVFLCQDRVRVQSGWTVGAFRQNAALQTAGVFLGDLHLEGRWHENIALEL